MSPAADMIEPTAARAGGRTRWHPAADAGRLARHRLRWRTWTTTQALAASNPATLSTHTFIAAGSYPVAAGAVVANATYAATFSAISGPDLQSVSWQFAEYLFSTPVSPADYNNLGIVPSGSSAGTVSNGSFKKAWGSNTCGPYSVPVSCAAAPPPPTKSSPPRSPPPGA